MNKFILLALIGLSVALACHQSCDCGTTNKYVCLSCKDPNAHIIESHKRACYCNEGYELEDTVNYRCVKVVEESESQEMDPCEKALVLLDFAVPLDIDCETDNSEIEHKVVSNINLRVDKSPIDPQCLGFLTSRVVYTKYPENPESDTATFYDFNPNYITKSNFNSKIVVSIPLWDVYNIGTLEQTAENQAIKQTIQMSVIFGHTRKEYRMNSWKVEVYTNRDQVSVFQIDTTKRYSSGCEEGKECIVIQDLDTYAEICEDETCENTISGTPTYEVGTYFYFKVGYQDPSFTKWLKFKKLLLKAGNDIFDHTQLVTPTYHEGFTVFKVYLMEPSLTTITIQVNMITVTSDPTPLSRFRRNLESSEESVQKQLELNIYDLSSSSSANLLGFVLANLLILALFF